MVDHLHVSCPREVLTHWLSDHAYGTPVRSGSRLLRAEAPAPVPAQAPTDTPRAADSNPKDGAHVKHKSQNSPAACSKAARWAARVSGPSTAMQSMRPTQIGVGSSLRDPTSHPYVNGYWATRPMPKSAMEAWMQRAAAKELHLPWAEKCYDYCDEIFLLEKGYTWSQIRRQRYHLNPLDCDRSFSSIHGQRAGIPGLQFARSRLDSSSCWIPKHDDAQAWMQIDMRRNTRIKGIVTQGRAPSDDCKENQYVKKIRVMCRPHGCERMGDSPQWTEFLLEVEGGGNQRREACFPHAVLARYVRIVALQWEGQPAMRAGVLLEKALDDHAARSPFTVEDPSSSETVSQTTTGHRLDGSEAHVAESSSSAAETGAGAAGSKASRWAARARQNSADTKSGSTTESVSPSSAAGDKICGNSKTSRWLARSSQVSRTTVGEPTVTSSTGAAKVPDPSVQVSSAGGKAARWAARAVQAAEAQATVTSASAAPQTSAASDTAGSQVCAHSQPTEGKAARWAARAAGKSLHSEGMRSDTSNESSIASLKHGKDAKSVLHDVEEPLIIHEARYGSASELWSVECGTTRQHGAKDVVEIIRPWIENNELHANPHRKPEYFNQVLWPEASGDGSDGPMSGPIPRRLAVRYSYGKHGQVKTVETPAVTHEAVALRITNITYEQICQDTFQYSGYVKNGRPDKSGEIQWRSLHGYSGEFRDGKPHGKGVHFFPDGSKVSANFVDGCPEGDGMLTGADLKIYDVSYAVGGGLTLQDGATPRLFEEANMKTLDVARMPCAALSIGPPVGLGNGKWEGNYPNLPAPDPSDGVKKVIAPFIWARPMHGDLPLWNSGHVRGKIVGMMRGPTAGAPASYGLKLHYAQQAGAAAVIFVDSDPSGTLFSFLPQIAEGPVTFGVKPASEIQVKALIPTVFVANKCWHGFTEGRMTGIIYYPPCKSREHPRYGYQEGMIVLGHQIGNGGLQKKEADTLMAQFLEDRKKERQQESEMLSNAKNKKLDQAEEQLKSREFYGGNFFDSMNPFKQVKETGNLDTKMQSRVVNTITQKTGLDVLQGKMKALQRDFENAIPVEVAWDEATLSGIKLPVLRARESEDVVDRLEVWSFRGRPECAISMRHKKDILFFMWLNALQNAVIMNSRIDGQFGVQEEVPYPPQKFNGEDGAAWIVSVDKKGFHISWQDKCCYCFEHRADWNREVADELIVEEEKSKNHVEITKKSPQEAILKAEAPQVSPQTHFEVDREHWRLVFRQTVPFTFSDEDDFAAVKLLNEDDDMAPNYSILSRLQEFRCKDGHLTFLLRYPEDSANFHIWRQASNPVTMLEEGVDNFEEIQSGWQDQRAPVPWAGLQRSDRRNKRCNCFLDGSVGRAQKYDFAIGVSTLELNQLPGPPGCRMKAVELYVSTTFAPESRVKPTNLDSRGFEWDQGTAKDNPMCEHGKPKSPKCDLCRDELAERFIIDHHPYLPCTAGHGPRWLWDWQQRGRGLLTLSSQHFFDEIEQCPSRSCKRVHFPVPYNPALEQDSCNGYFVLQYSDQLLFAGFLRHGLPDNMCSLKWADGAEFHGEFHDGEMTGYGRYIFSDGSEFRGSFAAGLPREGFYHPPDNDTRRVADYFTRIPNTPLWLMNSYDLMHPTMTDLPLPGYTWAKADCMVVSNCTKIPGTGTPERPAEFSRCYKHVSNTVTARLVWARPIYADQPLWNAEEVRGKICAVMRGPRPPARACNYSIKTYHVQNAGAVGVIFVDYDPDGVFNIIPRVESGPLWPNGPELHCRIPAYLTLNVMSGALQEGAIHSMAQLKATPKGLEQGWRCGVAWCRKQESMFGMSKAKAEDLMSEFFAERRQERAQENELLQDRLEDARSGLESSWEGREWMRNNFLDNLNFMKQDHNAPPPKTKSGTVTQAMLSKVTTKQNAKRLAERAETAGAMIGSALQGAVAVMTAEAASSEIVETMRAQTPGRQRPDSTRQQGSPRPSTPVQASKDWSRPQRQAGSGRGRRNVDMEKGSRRTTASSLHNRSSGNAGSTPADVDNKHIACEEAPSTSRDCRTKEMKNAKTRPMNTLFQQGSSAIQSSVVSLFTPPKPTSGSASKAPKSLPSWMNA